MNRHRSKLYAGLSLLALVAVATGVARFSPVWMGRQSDGSFLVSSGQRIEAGSIAFTGRPIDLAVHPSDQVFAVLNKSEVFPADQAGLRAGTNVSLSPTGRKVSAGFRGLVWSPDGTRLFASTNGGHIQVFAYESGKLRAGDRIFVQPASSPRNPVPGGMTITRDGTQLFVAAANRNAVVEVDLKSLKPGVSFPCRHSLLSRGFRKMSERWSSVTGGVPARPRRPDREEPGPRYRC